MKTIKINDKNVKVSFSPYSLLIYKQQFGLEPLDVVIGPLYNLCTLVDDVIQTGNVDGEVLIAVLNRISEAGHINLYGILWSFISAADPETPDFASWLREQEELPILDVLYEIAPDFIGSMVTKKKVDPVAAQLLVKSLVRK